MSLHKPSGPLEHNENVHVGPKPFPDLQVFGEDVKDVFWNKAEEHGLMKNVEATLKRWSGATDENGIADAYNNFMGKAVFDTIKDSEAKKFNELATTLKLLRLKEKQGNDIKKEPKAYLLPLLESIESNKITQQNLGLLMDYFDVTIPDAKMFFLEKLFTLPQDQGGPSNSDRNKIDSNLRQIAKELHAENHKANRDRIPWEQYTTYNPQAGDILILGNEKTVMKKQVNGSYTSIDRKGVVFTRHELDRMGARGALAGAGTYMMTEVDVRALSQAKFDNETKKWIWKNDDVETENPPE